MVSECEAKAAGGGRPARCAAAANLAAAAAGRVVVGVSWSCCPRVACSRRVACSLCVVCSLRATSTCRAGCPGAPARHHGKQPAAAESSRGLPRRRPGRSRVGSPAPAVSSCAHDLKKTDFQYYTFDERRANATALPAALPGDRRLRDKAVASPRDVDVVSPSAGARLGRAGRELRKTRPTRSTTGVDAFLVCPTKSVCVV